MICIHTVIHTAKPSQTLTKEDSQQQNDRIDSIALIYKWSHALSNLNRRCPKPTPGLSTAKLKQYCWNAGMHVVINTTKSSHPQTETNARTLQMKIVLDCIHVAKPTAKSSRTQTEQTPSVHNWKRGRGLRVYTCLRVQPKLPNTSADNDSRQQRQCWCWTAHSGTSGTLRYKP